MSEWAVVGSTAILVAAGLAHGLFGIGFAMIATPLLALFLDYRVAVLLAAIPLLCMAVSWLLVNRRQLHLSKQPASLLPAIVVGSLLGVSLQIGLPERASLLLLAALLGVSVITPWALARWRITAVPRPLRTAALFGGLAGITEAALNVGAPFVLIYATVTRLSRFEQLIVLNLCFALGKTIQVSLIFIAGAPDISPLALALGTTASAAAYYLGNGWANRFDERRFRQLLSYFLLVMIAALIVRALVM